MDLNDQWKKSIINIESSLRDAISCLELSGLKIVLIVNHAGEFIGTITDGDIRRGMVRGYSIDDKITNVINLSPYFIEENESRKNLMKIMLDKKIQHVPVIDSKKFLVDLISLDQLTFNNRISNFFVVMAGGKGTRLRPYTEDCPKPLLSIAGKPILLHLLEKARGEGFYNFIFSIGYLGDMIKDYFGDGEKFGVNIKYLEESFEMGTAGSLANISTECLVEPFVLSNGDVLIDMEYRDLLKFHLDQNSIATMVTKQFRIQHPYGVVKTVNNDILDVEEKPIWETKVNAGVYAMSPDSLNFLTKSTYFNMPDLFKVLRKNSKNIKSYTIDTVWHDIGRPEDLPLANEYLKLKLNLSSD